MININKAYIPQSLRKKINNFLQENNFKNIKKRINEAYEDEEFDDDDDDSKGKIPDYQSMSKQVKAYRQYVKDGIFTKEFQGMLANTVDAIAAKKQGISVEELQLRKKKGNEDKQQSMTDIEKNRLFYYICWLKGNKLWKDLFMRFMDASVANDQQWNRNEKFNRNKDSVLGDLDDAESYLDQRENNRELHWQAWEYNDYVTPVKDERSVQEWKKFKVVFGKALADALLTDFTRDKYNELSNRKFKIGTSEKSFVEWALKSGAGSKPEDSVDAEFVSREYQDTENLTVADYYFGEANKLFTRTVGINPKTGEFKKGHDFPEEVLDEIDKKYEKNSYNQIDFEIDFQQKKMELAEETDEDIENDNIFRSQYASKRDDPFLNPTRPANISDDEWNDYLAFRKADFEESQQIEKENKLKRQGKPVGQTIKRQDRLYEYQKVLNEIQKMLDLPFFQPHNLNKNVNDEGQFTQFIDTEFVDDIDEDTDYDDNGQSYSTKGIIKDVLTSFNVDNQGEEVQNVDKLVELMLLYAEFTAKMTFLKVSGAIKKSQAAMLSKQVDAKVNEEIDKNLKNVILIIYSKINELGPRYPDVTHKLGSCAREIDMYRSKIFNLRTRDKFWTLPSLVSVTGGLYKLETSGKPIATSGLQRSIAQMLMQATWAQQMLRLNKVGDLRVISFQSWLDMLDSEYYSSFGFQKKIDEKKTIEQKLKELVDAAKKEKSGFRYKKPEKIVSDRSQKLKKDVIKSLSKNKKYDELNALFTKLEDSIEDLKSELDVLSSGSSSAYLSDTSSIQDELNNYIMQYNEIKSKIARIENIARRNARSAQYSDVLKSRKDNADALAAKDGEDSAELDMEISTQIKNIAALLADIGVYDLRMYKKNKAGGKDLGPLSFSKSERDPELSADYIFNQAQVAKYDPSSKKLSVDPGLEKAMRNYYKYPDTFEEYVTSDPRANFYDSMHNVDVGVDIAPMYIEKLMTDKKSPFRNYHGILVSKFFDNERVASYTYDSGNKKFAGTVPDAINDYMRAEYNPDFGLADITNDVGRVVRNPGFEGDVLFTQKICEYALGFSNTDYDASLKKSALLEQNPQDFVKDLEKYWNKDFSKSMTPCTLIPGFDSNPGIRSTFWNEIAISSTTELDRVPENVKRLKRPLGNIAKAVMVKLYDPNIEKHYEEFINGLSEPLKAKIFNQSLNATEFYNLFKSDTIVEPDDYYKDKK